MLVPGHFILFVFKWINLCRSRLVVYIRSEYYSCSFLAYPEIDIGGALWLMGTDSVR